MSSRRRIAFPKAQTGATWLCNYSRDLRLAKWGSGVSLHSSNPEALMSALGQKRTWRGQIAMSALPLKADIPRSNLDVSFGPLDDIADVLLDHLVGSTK
jgi:hypothetical protein